MKTKNENPLAKVTLGDTTNASSSLLKVALKIIATELKHRDYDVKAIIGVLQ